MRPKKSSLGILSGQGERDSWKKFGQSLANGAREHSMGFYPLQIFFRALPPGIKRIRIKLLQRKCSYSLKQLFSVYCLLCSVLHAGESPCSTNSFANLVKVYPSFMTRVRESLSCSTFVSTTQYIRNMHFPREHEGQHHIKLRKYCHIIILTVTSF